MTITVTNIVAGPYVATGSAQSLPFPFKVFTPPEVEVIVGAERTAIDPALYSVTINKAVDGQVMEGGAIELSEGAVEPGVSVSVVAKPALGQELVFSDTASRLRNLNEGLDRAALRALRSAYDGVMEGAGQEILDLAAAAGAAAGLEAGAAASANKADRTGGNITPSDAPLFRGAIQAAPSRIKRGATPRDVADKVSERVSVKDYGAFGDGSSHTLAATTAFRGENTTGWSLAQWQVYFPSATSLSQEIDFLAHAEALRQAKADNLSVEVFVPAGKYMLGADGVVVSRNGTTIRGEGPNATIWRSAKPDGDIFAFKDMATGGIFNGTIAPLVVRTGGAAIRFDNCHNLVSRDMKFDPGAWHGGAPGAEHWSCYDMTAGDAQFLYTVEDFEMNDVRFGFRVGQTGGYVQDVWIGKGVCVARRAGIQAFNVGGLYIYNMPDFLGCYWGLHVVPQSGQVVSGMMVNGMLADTCEFHGVVLRPSAGGRIVDFQMSDVWASSSGTNVPGGGGSLNACGIYIDGTDGVVSGGIINGPRCINNVSHGIQIKNAERISISNPQCNYNSVQSPGSFHGVMLDAGATNISVTGGLSGPAGKFKAQGLPTTQAYGIFINAGAVSCRITSVDVSSNITGGVYNAGTACYVITPGAGLTQAAGATNTLGTAGFNRAPIPDFAVATSLHVSIGGFEPICGFNVYYDFGGATWRYQNDGPAAALVAYPAGLTLVRFAANSSGPDAVAAIASSGLVATV